MLCRIMTCIHGIAAIYPKDECLAYAVQGTGAGIPW
ncbi:hypothetical protein GXY_13918 [Novacetimonas hansenii ATCC 23769]|uniref:Uncharacterized protein n=1 Tax=Novacetimonas hansenii ATCC 23769 TaxID=714995 RepID=D5QI05_NOVHA|nr:hypothetical protein GXY_13918 [Novacetimonas hansenii ATCC 23769]